MTSPVPRFASIFNADVIIKKNKNNNFKIIFNSSIITLYQIWSYEYPELNSQISCFNYTEKEWITLFKLNKVDPTIIIFIKNKKFAFVIKKVKYKNKKMSWLIRSDDIIVNSSNNVKTKLLLGNYNNIRINVNNLTTIKDPFLSTSQDDTFNQLVEGKVKITKIDDYTFLIKFLEASEFTLYQIRKDINDTTRIIKNMTPSDWITMFNNNQPFQPTTIMERENKKYIFVIEYAEIENNNMSWIVKTNQLLNLSSTIKTLDNDIFGKYSFSIDGNSNNYIIPYSQLPLNAQNSFKLVIQNDDINSWTFIEFNSIYYALWTNTDLSTYTTSGSIEWFFDTTTNTENPNGTWQYCTFTVTSVSISGNNIPPSLYQYKQSYYTINANVSNQIISYITTNGNLTFSADGHSTTFVQICYINTINNGKLSGNINVNN